ncbi:MAG: hypothetical protein AAGG68_19550 [Bacteroidota bacterium]
MKTAQIFSNSILGLVLLLVFGMTSCQKEKTVDPDKGPVSKMMEATSTYEYNSRFYTWDTNSESLRSLGTDFYDDGIMNVRVINGERIEFREDDELMFTGVNLKEQEGGFTFEVLEQVVEDPELGTIKVKGWDHYRELGDEVPGLYMYTFEYLNLALEFEVDGGKLIMLTEFTKID